MICCLEGWGKPYGEAARIEDVEETTEVCYSPAIVIALDDLDGCTGNDSGGRAVYCNSYQEEG